MDTKFRVNTLGNAKAFPYGARNHVPFTTEIMKTIWKLVALGTVATSAVLAGDMETEFRDPPDAARPGVYWYFMDGNQDCDEMVADLLP